MRFTRLLLWFVSRLVPASARPRWREEWLAELQHGGWRMLAGALPDAWAMRRLARRDLPPKGGGYSQSHLWLPASAGRPHRPFHAIGQDVRYTLRGLAATPGFVAGLVLSLSLGMIGMTGAFSIVNSVALRPLPGIVNQEQLFELRLVQPMNGLPYAANTLERYASLRKRHKSFVDMAAHHSSEMIVAFPGEPLATQGMFVSHNYFSVLGVSPSVGHLIGPSHGTISEQSFVAVLSYEAWLRHFGGDPSTVGSLLKVNGQLLQIIGVAPPEFTGLRRELDDDDGPRVWVPMSLQPLLVAPATDGRPVATFVGIVARLRPDVSRREAEAELSVLAANLPRGHRPESSIDGRLVGLGPKDASPVDWLEFFGGFMAVPAIVLALACLNAANLLASRASRRLRDTATRLSVGATRWRVVRLLLVESMILALGATLLGLAFTVWAMSSLEQYFAVAIHIDWRVAAFAGGLSAATALAFGLIPALSAASRANDLMRGMSRRSGIRGRAVLIASQAALSLALMLTGWQFVNTVRARAENDGIRNAEHLVTASWDVSALKWPASEINEYYDRVIARVTRLPGVTSASYSCQCSPWGAWSSRGGGSAYVWLGRHSPEKPGSTLAMYSGGNLFAPLELPIVAGRRFQADEHRGPVRAIVVNQPFAEKYLSGQPLGQSLRIGATNSFAESQPVVVVGVVQAPAGGRTDASPLVYYPAPLETMPARTLYVRFSRPATDQLAVLHAAIREVHPDAPRPDIATAEQRRWDRNKSNQFIAVTVSLLGLLSLLLAAGGLYGVIAFVVTLRSQEIAVRMALGAQPREVVRMIMGQALKPAAVGAAIGVFGAVATGLIVRARLYGATVLDPTVFGGAVTVLFVVLAVATMVPAARAARINPIDALRNE
jgi:predicted permease